MRKDKLLLFFSILGMTTLTGCGTEDASSGKIGVRFSTWDSAESLDEQQALVDRFNESQEEIYVTLEGYGGEYDTKLNASIGGKDAPDVMYMWNYPAYAPALEPLHTYIESEGEAYGDNFYEALLEYNSYDNQVYGIPVGFTTHGLYYNKDLFAQAGIEEPTEDWTWQDLEEAAKTISETLEGVKGFGFNMKPDPVDFEMYLWSNGTAYTDSNGNIEGNLNAPEAVEVVGMFQDMVKDGYAISTEGSGTTEFTNGKIAMYVYGAWSINSLDEAGVNYGITNIPSFEGQDSVSIISSSGVSMSKDSENKDAAWEFIKYWTSEQLNEERLAYELSPLRTVVEKHGIMEDETYVAFYRMLEKSEGHTPSSYILENWSEVSSGLSLAYERVFNPSVLEDPETVLNETTEEVK